MSYNTAIRREQGGVSGTAVSQASDRTLYLILRPFS
jgi:hypothetical protein